jgi:hypothetical protein
MDVKKMQLRRMMRFGKMLRFERNWSLYFVSLCGSLSLCSLTCTGWPKTVARRFLLDSWSESLLEPYQCRYKYVVTNQNLAPSMPKLSSEKSINPYISTG